MNKYLIIICCIVILAVIITVTIVINNSKKDKTNTTASRPVYETFEYIIVGSGAGGGPLACNLARNGHKVLLLEAGVDNGQSLEYQVPAWHGKSTEYPDMQWDYFVRHWDNDKQQNRDEKVMKNVLPGGKNGVWYPRAGTLGGCTAHNAMITVYPNNADWDAIAKLTGDYSWSAKNMRNYYNILENCKYMSTGTKGHGFNGWLSTNTAPVSLGLGDAKIVKTILSASSAFSDTHSFWEKVHLFNDIKEVAALITRDLNNDDKDHDIQEGLFSVPIAVNNGKRNGPRDFIVKTVQEGYPLTVRTACLCSKVLFADKLNKDGTLQAVGIDYLQGRHLYRADPNASKTENSGVKNTAYASREVILSGGAFNTPQLLKLSGIGAKDEVEKFGIKSLINLPGVGTNLQDKYELAVVSKWNSDLAILDGCTFDDKNDPCLDDWKKDPASSVYGTNGVAFTVVAKSDKNKPVSDLFLFGIPGNFAGYKPGYSKIATADHRHFTWAVLKGFTKNHAGTVKLVSANPRDTPAISFKYFEEGTNDKTQANSDLQAVVNGVKMVRNINSNINSLSISDVVEEEKPGKNIQTDEELKQYVRDNSWGHHACCTCPIGADGDPNAVLDSNFRVRGTTGLRVVDASAFPIMPGLFMVLPVYMASEKATDVILASIGEKRKVITVQIKTGSKIFSGTNSDVYINFGTKSFKLDKPMYNDFEKGDNDIYIIDDNTLTDKDLSTFSLEIKPVNYMYDDWYVEKVSMFNTGKLVKSVNPNVWLTKSSPKWKSF